MENIHEKINKLLEMARRGGTENEMLVAMAKAQELLLKHNISMSDVTNTEVADEDVTEERIDGNQSQAWQGIVLSGISNLYFCTAYSTTYQLAGKRKLSYVIVGKPSNVAIVKVISGYIISVGSELAKNSGQDTLYRNSFKKGFASRVSARCREEIANASTKLAHENACTSLIVVNPYAVTKKENYAFLAAKGVHLHFARRNYTSRSPEGYSAGQSAGNSVNLRSSAVGRLN